VTLRPPWLRWLLVVAAIGCFIVGVFPHSRNWVDSASGEKISARWIGLWLSPLQYRVHRTSARGGIRIEEGTNWLSLSSLVILLGVGSLEAFRRAGSASRSGREGLTAGP
jgi:hypothetical protein